MNPLKVAYKASSRKIKKSEQAEYDKAVKAMGQYLKKKWEARDLKKAMAKLKSSS